MAISPTMPLVPRDRAADELARERVAQAGVHLVDLQFSDLTGGVTSATIPFAIQEHSFASSLGSSPKG